MATVYERHSITLEEYHRMVEAGVFDRDSRVELVEGELIEMPPIHPPHASCVDRILFHFITRLRDRAWVRCQHPITLPPDSEPQPDLVLAAIDQFSYADHHPAPQEILLAVEVAESTLPFDRRIKLPLYARSEIREFWLVNLVDDEIEVYREPAGAWYRAMRTYRRDESLSPAAFPEVRFEINDLLPPKQ